MTGFFTRQRFGRPQFLAGALLLLFLAQAVWLVHSELRMFASSALSASEEVRIAAGWRQIHGGEVAGAPFPDPPGALPMEVSRDDAGFDAEHSPLISLVTAAPLLAWPRSLLTTESYWRWLPRLPFLAFGVFLGASLWYVAADSAATPEDFSPSLSTAFSRHAASHRRLARRARNPRRLGKLRIHFTAIAVAHTLYAPREVVVWNWRRIVLLGISLAISIGSQFSMIVVVPIALAFLLYLAPIRRGAALTIWSAACLVALLVLFATYFFHARTFLNGMEHASFWEQPGAASPCSPSIARSRSKCFAPARLRSIDSRRPRNLHSLAAHPLLRQYRPLLIGLLFIALGIAHPRVAGAGFLLASVPFLFIFVSGVIADLLETPSAPSSPPASGP